MKNSISKLIKSYKEEVSKYNTEIDTINDEVNSLNTKDFTYSMRFHTLEFRKIELITKCFSLQQVIHDLTILSIRGGV